MNPTPLGTLFTCGRDDAAPVAVRDGETLCWRGLAADVAATAAAVREAGIARGALLSADPYRFLVGLLGLLYGNATAVVLPDALPATVQRLAAWYDGLVSDEPVSAATPVLPIREGVPFTSKLGPLDPAGAVEYFTSGTTGAAKRVVKPVAQLDAEIALLDVVWGADTAGKRALATVPHRHAFGMMFLLLWPLATGRAFVSHVDDMWESVLARGVADAILVTSPAHLLRLQGIAPLRVGCRPSRVFSAGAPLSAAQAQEAAKALGVLPTEMFGSTETGVVATRVQPAADEPWSPLPGVQAHANDDGCLVVVSPLAPDGVPFVSADRVEVAPDGRFHFLGRTDRIAKIAAARVSLTRVEKELAALAWVAEAAAVVLAEPDARLAAAIVLDRDGRERLADLGAFRLSRELRRRLAQTLEPASLPKSWRFVAALPVDAMGKRRDGDVRALFAPNPNAAQ